VATAFEQRWVLARYTVACSALCMEAPAPVTFIDHEIAVHAVGIGTRNPGNPKTPWLRDAGPCYAVGIIDWLRMRIPGMSHCDNLNAHRDLFR